VRLVLAAEAAAAVRAGPRHQASIS
jgi:hypothetical protein